MSGAEERLPDGSKAWFVRVRRGLGYQITPCAKEGWFVLAGFIAVNMLSVLLLIPEPTLLRWIAWSTVILGAAVLLVVIAYRTSAPGWRDL